MALPVLVLLLLAGLSVISAVTTRMQCLDAAREAALAAARGEPGAAVARPFAPSGASITTSIGEDAVHAEVSADVHLLGSLLPPITVSGAATAALEPGAGSP